MRGIQEEEETDELAGPHLHLLRPREAGSRRRFPDDGAEVESREVTPWLAQLARGRAVAGTGHPTLTSGGGPWCGRWWAGEVGAGPAEAAVWARMEVRAGTGSEELLVELLGLPGMRLEGEPWQRRFWKQDLSESF